MFSEDRSGCEGLAHKAIQPWIDEHKLKAATAPLRGSAERGSCVFVTLPRAGEPLGVVCAEGCSVLRGMKAACAQRAAGSAAVCLYLYGEEEAQPRQTIANLL